MQEKEWLGQYCFDDSDCQNLGGNDVWQDSAADSTDRCTEGTFTGMKHSPRKFIAVATLVVLLLTGCAATGPAFQPVANVDPGSGLVYVYRAKTFALGARAAYFYINDVNVFDLNADGYSWVSLPAGTYKLKQKWAADIWAKPVEVNLDVRPGETRYLSFETGVCASGYKEICLQWTLRSETAQVGQQAIVDKKFQENFGLTKMQEQLRAR